MARQTAEVPVAEPQNVFSLAKKRVLVIAKAAVFRYELGQTAARRYAPIPVPGPMVAWPDLRRANSFRVHAAGELSLQEYSLPPLAGGEAGASPDLPKLTPRVEPLPEFDSRLFTVLADGAPLYSTPRGLVRRGQESRPAPFPELSGPVTSIFPDASPDRYWAGDGSGKLGSWDRKQGATPVFTSSVPGVVIDAALEGPRVAVLSIELVGQDYRPTVTIFSNGKLQAQLPLGPSVASLGQPKLDLCLIPGRPWVVVGGAQWLQLLDWGSRRLLAEW